MTIANENNGNFSSATNQQFSPSLLPILPCELVEEILCRLSVKLLLQFRRVCKLWNSLISDPKFAKKHLNKSTTHWINSLGLIHPRFLTIYPPKLVFNTTLTTKVTHLEYISYNCDGRREIVGSCNGILCLAYEEFILLWNPSINKLKELPILQKLHYPDFAYGFGYDFVTDNYKVVVVLRNSVLDSNGNFVEKTQVKVNTLGTQFWKNIQEFPFGTVPNQKSGKYVCGTINWLASSQYRPRSNPCFIVSLDLGNESYKKILLADYGEVNVNSLILDVLRDCLCMISGHDVWLMKEYGSEESWTKLFTISVMLIPSLSYSLSKLVYVFEDSQVLLQFKRTFCPPELIVYDPRIDTVEFTKFPKSFYDLRFGNLDVSKYGGPEFCIESLISPCS